MAWQKRIALFKFRCQRTYGYVNIWLPTVATWLFLRDMFDVPKWTFIFIIPIAILFVWIFGTFEDKSGLSRAEYELNTDRMGLGHLKKEKEKDVDTS